MRSSCMRSILIAVATLTCSSPALADVFVIQASPPSPDADVVVTIGDPSTAVDASTNAPRFELPVVRINPTDAAPSSGIDIGLVDFAPPTPAGDVPVHSAPATTPRRSDDLLIDPVTGLMIPRFANPAPVPSSAAATSRSRAPTRRHPASPYGRLHVDPVTGLMIPDFGESTFPTPPAAPGTTTGRTANRTRRSSAAAATSSTNLPGHLHIDPTTGLMIPNGMEMPHGTSTF